MAVLQLEPATGGPLAYVGTFVVTAAFYALTAHLAARWVLGNAPVRPAIVVGAIVAAISLLLQRFEPAVVIPVSLAGDYLAIQSAYRLAYRRAGLVAIVHYAISAILGITLFNLWRLLASAPG